MTNETTSDGLRARISRGGEDALGRLAQELIESPLVAGTVARVFEAREKAAQAQEVAMSALNLPSAADLERLTRRVRSVSQRLEGIEDGVDRLDQRVTALGGVRAVEQRLDGIEAQIASLATQLSRLGDMLTPAASQPVPTTPRPTRARAAAAKKRASAKPKTPAKPKAGS